MKSIILTGATSMLGIALTEKCIRENVRVLAVINPDSGRKNRVPDHELVKKAECPLDRIGELPDLLEKAGNTGDPERSGYDAFYHLAWMATSHNGRNDTAAQTDNIRYALDAVEAASKLGIKRFVGAGSQAEYGRTDAPLAGDTPAFPETPYGAAKLAAGQMTRILCAQLGIVHIWTRILSAYGPNDGKNTLISSLIRALLDKEEFGTTAGEQIWDYIYCDDVANALFLLGDKGTDGKIYPIGSGSARPLKAFIEEAKELIDPGAEIGYGKIPYGEKQVMHLQADITELTKDTGFRPEISFEEGIRRTIRWMGDNR
ncbi:MAG: NAD-dependent epimerase/dehydratase family protein [Lachnospiraceae bacterium]|nr:NAD-dependent epimerase/dehydratase family protein [Lachnospiraceae bacterium]